MSKLSRKEWLEDLQENGDDGTGHCDYEPEMCDQCKEEDNA